MTTQDRDLMGIWTLITIALWFAGEMIHCAKFLTEILPTHQVGWDVQENKPEIRFNIPKLLLCDSH